MDLLVAKSLAISLMRQHGLGHVPFQFDKGKRRMGQCTWRRHPDGTYTTTRISLSEYWTKARTPAEVEQTILHEIAHGLTPGHKHNFVWKRQARLIGATGDRCSAPSAEARQKMETLAPAAWMGSCPAGHTHPMYRKPQRMQFCGQCKGSYKSREIVWKFKGRTVSDAEFGPKYQKDRVLLSRMKG